MFDIISWRNIFIGITKNSNNSNAFLQFFIRNNHDHLLF